MKCENPNHRLDCGGDRPNCRLRDYTRAEADAMVAAERERPAPTEAQIDAAVEAIRNVLWIQGKDTRAAFLAGLKAMEKVNG